MYASEISQACENILGIINCPAATKNKKDLLTSLEKIKSCLTNKPAEEKKKTSSDITIAYAWDCSHESDLKMLIPRGRF